MWQQIRIARDVLQLYSFFLFSRQRGTTSDPERARVRIYVYIYIYTFENCFIDEALESNNWRVPGKREKEYDKNIRFNGISIDVHASIKRIARSFRNTNFELIKETARDE